MTLLAFVVVAIAGIGALVYVIVQLLAENRRLTAAAIAPHPEAAVAVLRGPQPKRQRDDERPTHLIGA